MLKSRRSYFVSYSFETKGNMLVHTKKKPVGLNELRAELAQKLKLPGIHLDNIVLLDRRALTNEEKQEGATVGSVPKDSGKVEKPGDNSVRGGEEPTPAPSGGEV